ncbi:LexA family protein [Brevundimonas balnearis]|uniref:LexA family protein n=1 Tax=Brevundimonas balnearis TaxID=1572858 RepID=A0ABV6R3U5_9CAUL
MSDVAEIARRFLAQAVKASGLAPYALAKRAGVAPTTITRPLNDESFKFTPKLATLLKISEASGVPLPAGVFDGPATAPSVGDLPVIGPVQAGAWLEVDETPQDEPVMLAVALDRRYPHARQWLREVKGDSMDARGITPGDLAHLVDFTGAGAELRSGQVVEVTRTRAGGALREITLKEVEITPGAILLWPRSTNPRWTEPVQLDDGDGTDVEVQVTGLLVQTIKRFS